MIGAVVMAANFLCAIADDSARVVNHDLWMFLGAGAVTLTAGLFHDYLAN
jgi:hypothetical protein